MRKESSFEDGIFQTPRAWITRLEKHARYDTDGSCIQAHEMRLGAWRISKNSLILGHDEG